MRALRHLLVLAGCVAILHCSKDAPKGIFDPDLAGGSTPVISAVTPDGGTLSGVGEVMIQGQNFSGDPNKLVVYFDAEFADIVSASSSEITVKTPAIFGDSIRIRIGVQGAEKLSNPIFYALKPAVEQFGTIEDAGESDIEAYSVAIDLQENVYVSVFKKNKLIRKIAPDGATSAFSAPTFVRANDMKFGPGSNLFTVSAAGRVRKLAQFDAAGTEETFANFRAAPFSFDFDAAGNIWAAVDDDIFLVKPDKSATSAAVYPGEIRTVRVYDGALYVLGEDGAGGQQIWRSSINGEALGTSEVHLDLNSSAWLEGEIALSMTFSAAGELLVGSSHPEGIFVVDASGGGAVLYPGLVGAGIVDMEWGTDRFLYAIRTAEISDGDGGTVVASKVLKIDANRTGAPYYGRQ